MKKTKNTTESPLKKRSVRKKYITHHSMMQRRFQYFSDSELGLLRSSLIAADTLGFDFRLLFEIDQEIYRRSRDGHYGIRVRRAG